MLFSNVPHGLSIIFIYRLKSNILGKSVHEYANGGTLASTLAKLDLEQSTVNKLETQELLSLSLHDLQVNDNNVILPNGDTVLNGAALLYCSDRLESTNTGTVDHLLDEEGVYHFNYLIDGERIVTADARATLEDAGVMLFLQEASAKERGGNTSFFPMEVSAASSLANEEVDVHDMRVPVTNLSKAAPQLGKCK